MMMCGETSFTMEILRKKEVMKTFQNNLLQHYNLILHYKNEF